ncbi:MAG: hypothetical protein JNK64_25410 [Myxococcales bacterium]|nr:hypothetical protein [Myxococcales bacterium]
MSALLRQDDHKARIFNREGKDGAIDALSGDGKTVFQSKYHHGGSSSLAFADAKKELAKIEKHRTAGDKWYATWHPVEHWCLVTNVPFGTQDEQRWKDEVEPEFAKLGLTAAYKTSADLQLRLIRHRDIADAFFGDRPRLFVSLAEHREALIRREVLERSYDIPLEGREAEMATVRDFVQNSAHHVLLVEGEGGVGKTRLQYEAAAALADEGIVETVYCGTAHLAASPSWYLGIVPESTALVLIDDPTDAEFIKRFVGEFGDRTRHWKAIITVRSQRDPVIAPLKDPRDRLLAPTLVLTPLPEAPAVRLASELLRPLAIADDQRARAERWLATVCGRFPIWMTVAAKLLESRDDLRELPADGFKIAKEYVAEIVHHTPPEIATPVQALEALRWIALVQPLNRLSDDALERFASAAGLSSAAQAVAIIDDFARRRAVTLFGVNKRMVEVRPDVLRDHLLIEWLTADDAGGGRRPSPAARTVADQLAADALEGRPNPFMQQVVSSLARLEFTIEPPPPFLDPLANAAVALAERASDTLAQQQALELASAIALFRPAGFARVSTVLRTRDVPVGSFRTVLGEHGVPRARVLGAVPWELFRAARGAMSGSERVAILRELIELVDIEAAAPARRANDGKSASELLQRVLHERHSYRSSFHKEAAALASDVLNRVAAGEPPRESAKVLVGALIALERHDGYTSPDDPNAFTFESFTISPDAGLGKIAASIRERLWAIASKVGPFTPAKRFAWPLLDAMHGGLNRSGNIAGWRRLLLDDLARCLALATDAATQLEDLQAARALWDWHVAFGDDDSEGRRLATNCEAAYLKHPVVARYAAVFASDRIESDRVLQEAAEAWPATATAQELEEYVEGALLYARTHAERWTENRVISFVSYLGERHGADSGVRDFVAAHLARGVTSPLFQVALRLANAALWTVRQRGDDASVRASLDWLDAAVRDDEARLRLLESLYPGAGKLVARVWSDADRAFMDRHWTLIERLSVQSRFFVMGRRLQTDPSMMARITDAVAPLDAAARSEAVVALWSGYDDLLPYPFKAEDISMPVVDFLLDFLVMEPDLSASHGHASWEIEQILKAVPRKPASWLAEVIRRRVEVFGPHNKQVAADKFGEYTFILPSDDALIWRVVERLPDEEPTAEAVAAIARLFEIATTDTTVDYYLGQTLAKLDPHGRVGPQVVARRLADVLDVPDVDAICTWARLAGWYPIGSWPWRVIASAACARVFTDATDDERYTVFSALHSHRIQSWSGRPGELHPRFQSAVDDAKRSLDAETDPFLRPYWEWAVKVAEHHREREKGKLEEREL